LAGEDARKAYQAIWRLVAAPAQAVALLQERLAARAAADPKRVARLIADLDSETSAMRQKATAELEQMGAAAEPALRKAQKAKTSLEVRQRLNGLLAKLDGPSGEWPRVQRAVEVLEHLGTAEARQALKTLARTASEGRVKEESQAALQRLVRQPVRP